MAHLVDTSILARLTNTADALHAVAANAVLELHQRGEVLHVTAQNLVEFRNLVTRPRHLMVWGCRSRIRRRRQPYLRGSFRSWQKPRISTQRGRRSSVRWESSVSGSTTPGSSPSAMCIK